MPRRKSSVKRTRADKKRHLRNVHIKTKLKKTIKKFQALLASKNLSEAKTALISVCSQLDKAAKKKIVHPATANRKKSRLTKKLLKAA